MDKDHIIREIVRTAADNDGFALGKARFAKETGIRESDWKGVYWINWSDAVKEAGVKTNTFNKAYDDDDILQKLATYICELGHFPQRAELNLKRRNDPSFPSEKTIRKYGKQAFVAKAVIEWCKGKEDWDDVVNICSPLAKNAIEPESETSPTDESMLGYVYLMKSGKYYKIGRTGSLDRRQYELGMQLAEGIEPIHSISTDDPSGIEAYWHNRFKEKHMNGEWFDLTKADVTAFKRRKFM